MIGIYLIWVLHLKRGIQGVDKASKTDRATDIGSDAKTDGWKKALSKAIRNTASRSKRIFFDLVQNSGLQQVVGIVISTGLKGLR